MILVYIKSTDDASAFEKILEELPEQEISVLTENRRSFSALEKKAFRSGDVIAALSPASFGLLDADIKNRLSRLVRQGVIIVLCSHPATYEYGLSAEANHAAISAIMQSMRPAAKMKARPGRPKTEFPDGWDELYEKWEKKEISSGEFIERSGLKKATFYNMLAEYKSQIRRSEEFVNRHTG